jgi:hypothetical protein
MIPSVLFMASRFLSIVFVALLAAYGVACLLAWIGWDTVRYGLAGGIIAALLFWIISNAVEQGVRNAKH